MNLKLRYTVLVIYCLIQLVANAKTEPVAGLTPSGTVPILYINTENNAPIDQKEVYINATAWFDASMCDDCESLGSEEKPLSLGIRGRGNFTWTVDGPKPYKLKFDKKQSFFGLTSNKHWVLIAIQSYQNLYNDNFGLKLGEYYSLRYPVKRYMVEIVLNGVYNGAYMLSENIRIDKGRVDIYEQPDLNENEETVPYGWLVELDNNEDPCQIKLPQPNGSVLRVTYHSPEELSAVQKDWLYDQFECITNAVYNSNRLDREWEKYIDIDDWAKTLLAQESVHNYDAFAGSTYLFKDKGDEIWHFGPLWDMSWSLDGDFDTLICERNDIGRALIDEIIKFPRFRRALRKHFDEFMENVGTEWIEKYELELKEKYQAALDRSQNAWPEFQISNGFGIASYYLLRNIDYIQRRLYSDLKVFNVKVSCEYEKSEVQTLLATGTGRDNFKVPDFFIDGLQYDEVDVNKGQDIMITLNVPIDKDVDKVLINGEESSVKAYDNKVELTDIREDLDVRIVYVDKNSLIDDVDFAGEYSVDGRFITNTSMTEIAVYNICGTMIGSMESGSSMELPQSGLYLVKSGYKVDKILIR